MKAGHKFLLGAALIVGSVGFLIAEGVKETGVYFLTPDRAGRQDGRRPDLRDERRASRWAPRSCPARSAATTPRRTIDFKVSDGVKTYPVTYHGLVPDTFTDANDIEVSSRAGSAATASSAPPTCSPSAARATRPCPKPENA